ncbi:MAG TPA: sulfate ABC transporter permease subunit CysT [Gaiellaceae bacterium]|nr:sulfate ABC transporter permease subunit CysT [Gaiellaceae bacterium]
MAAGRRWTSSSSIRIPASSRRSRRRRPSLSTPAVSVPSPRVVRGPGAGVAQGIATAYLTLVVLLPLAALVWHSTGGGAAEFRSAITDPQAVAALKLTIFTSVLVAGINAVMGTVVAWILVRDTFPGQSVVNALVDLPFALPTIVAGLTLLTLYGPMSPVNVDLAFKRTAVVVALLFVTLPFVIRTVQPVLLELDREMEEAAASLGARSFQIFRRIILPNLLPAILSGTALAFARAIGEFGALVLITGNLPFDTEVASVYIFGRIESGESQKAAAVSVVLLVISFLALLLIAALRRRVTRHESAA